MADELDFDLVVLGGGPGGYVAAIRAAQLGFKTACIEKEDALGGTCVRVGCIPSKALLDSTELFDQIRHKTEAHGIRVGAPEIDVAAMHARKQAVVKANTDGVAFLFRKNKVEWIRGFGRLTSPETLEVETAEGTRTVRTKHVVLATGSVPVELPFLKFDHERIVDSTGALAFPEVPGHLVVVGGGVIGLELGSVWLRLGAKVTVLEMAPTILPGMDAEIVRQADRIFRKQGFEIRTGTRVTGAERKGDKVVVTVEGADPHRGGLRAGRGGAAGLHGGDGLRGGGDPHGPRRDPGGRALPHRRGERLRHRRRHRRADAGAQGGGGGRGGGGEHRRQARPRELRRGGRTWSTPGRRSPRWG